MNKRNANRDKGILRERYWSTVGYLFKRRKARKNSTSDRRMFKEVDHDMINLAYPHKQTADSDKLSGNN